VRGPGARLPVIIPSVNRDAPPPITIFHDVRHRQIAQRGGKVEETVEQWRMAGGRLYEKRTRAGEPDVVRVVSGEAGFEMAGNKTRRLRPAEIAAWQREVRMVPSNFLAHAGEMKVTESESEGLKRFEAPGERLALEVDAKSGVPRQAIDLRSKKSIRFDNPKDVGGRHWPRLEIHMNVDREAFRDRIETIEFDRPVPADVKRLWEALEKS
jgi:hypothetical protein